MNHLVHWLTAYNEYNLHSPFVFDLYTQVIRARVKEHFGGATYEQLYKFINHFSAKRIWVEQTDAHITHAINSANPDALFVSNPSEADFLIVTNPQRIPTYIPTEHTIIFVIHPHRNRAIEDSWAELYNRLHARVSIDLYHTGILFFRTALYPQHFRLR